MAGLARMKGWTRRLLGSAPASVPEPPRLVLVEPEPFRGEIQAITATHVEGWVQSVAAPQRRVPFEAVLPRSGRIVATGVADQFMHGLHQAGGGDGAHGFLVRFDPPLDAAEQDALELRLPSGAALPRTPALGRTFEPIRHVAMDIVDNCNLRCPFCLYDYAHVHATHLMTEETIDAALRLLPYTRDAEFWFSCLHEPTLHPRLTEFVDKVPRPLRRKLFYTTNLAKRMKPAYFEWLADNAMHHVNISIESRDPALYERMRAGARHRIFMENWDALLRALEQGSAPPLLRYNIMAYKSNLHELPELVRYLLEERRASQVELRYTFDVPHLTQAFRDAEFLDRDEWLWLRDQLAHYPAARVLLLMPPASQTVEPAAPAADPAAPPAGFLPYRYLFRISWDGSMRVVGMRPDSRYEGTEGLMLESNVRDVADPGAFLDQLARRAG